VINLLAAGEHVVGCAVVAGTEVGGSGGIALILGCVCARFGSEGVLDAVDGWVVKAVDTMETVEAKMGMDKPVHVECRVQGIFAVGSRVGGAVSGYLACIASVMERGSVGVIGSLYIIGGGELLSVTGAGISRLL